MRVVMASSYFNGQSALKRPILTLTLSGRYTLVCPSHSQPLLVPFRSVPGGNGLGGRPPGSAMFISVQDLQLQEIPFQEEFSAEALELGSELRQAAPAKASGRDRKSTRLNSSHMSISYAV